MAKSAIFAFMGMAKIASFAYKCDVTAHVMRAIFACQPEFQFFKYLDLNISTVLSD